MRSFPRICTCVAAVLALVGCGAHTIGEDDDAADESSSETGEEPINASASVGCGPDDGPTLEIVEDPVCGSVGFVDGFNLSWEPSSEDPIGTHDILAESWGTCRLCSAGECEDASACILEITEASDTQLVGQLDAEFPSGSLSRHVNAVMCESNAVCG